MAAKNQKHRKVPKDRKRCKARNKEGGPCGAAPMRSGLCHFHSNRERARELGRIGGRKNGRAKRQSIDPSFALDTALAIRDALNRLYQDLRSGKVRSRDAAVLASLLTLQCRVIGITDHDERIKELEKQLWEQSPSRAGAGDAIPLDSDELPKVSSRARNGSEARTNGSEKPQ
jgi:hypothetical protein